MQVLISELQNGNDQKRRAASYKLRNFKEPAAVKALINAYADADSSVRQNALDGLRAIGSQEAQEFLISKGQSITSPEKSASNWRLLPIVAGIFSCVIVGVIGIFLVSPNVYASDPNASPGKGIGAIAFIVSFVVFYITKQWVDKKLKK